MPMSINISPKHGVNPAVEQCFYCRKDIGVVLFGRMTADKAEQAFGEGFMGGRQADRQDVEAPHQVITSLDPCEGCEVFYFNAKIGVFLILSEEREVEVFEHGRKVFKTIPHPTGAFVCVKESAIVDLIQPPVLEEVLKSRRAMLSRETWDLLGLDR